MIDFTIHFESAGERGSVQTDKVDYRTIALHATGLSIDGTLPDANFFPAGEHGPQTVGEMAAFVRKFNAEIHYHYYGWPDANEVVRAFMVTDTESVNSLFSMWNYVDLPKRHYLGKFNTDMDFIRHLFEKNGQQWLFDTIDWEAGQQAFMQDFHVSNGHYFAKR